MGCFPEHPYHAKAGAFALLGFRLTAFAFLPASFLAWSHFAPCCNSEAVRVTANTTAAVTAFSVRFHWSSVLSPGRALLQLWGPNTHLLFKLSHCSEGRVALGYGSIFPAPFHFLSLK